MRPLRVGIVAGEASGDVLAAGLLKALKQQYPRASFVGIGGKHLIEQGLHSLFDMNELSVMGLVEVLKHLPRLLHIRRQVIQHFIQHPPDVFIGVDAPDFNLAVAKALKSAGIPTIHYVSPTVWAWRESRIHKIAKATNLVLGIFPFEAPLYARYEVPYRFVGHTMADAIDLVPDQGAARTSFSLPMHETVLAILPGSRAREVSSLLPDFLATAGLIQQHIPDLKVLIPAANAQRKQQIESLIAAYQPNFTVQVTERPAREVMIAANAVLLASGTATLEAMLCKKPMLVAYKMSSVTYAMMKRLYKPDYFALPNILAEQALVPELLQEQVNPHNMAEKLVPMLQDTEYAEQLKAKFTQLHISLRKDADQQAAQAVAELISR